jgi:hypothetical protein
MAPVKKNRFCARIGQSTKSNALPGMSPHEGSSL